MGLRYDVRCWFDDNNVLLLSSWRHRITNVCGDVNRDAACSIHCKLSICSRDIRLIYWLFQVPDKQNIFKKERRMQRQYKQRGNGWNMDVDQKHRPNHISHWSRAIHILLLLFIRFRDYHMNMHFISWIVYNDLNNWICHPLYFSIA